MPSTFLRVPRYLHAWLTDRARVSVREVEVDRDGVSIPLTLLAPRPARRSPPAWIVLHGITRSGRRHPTLVRFTRALAAAGAVVAVPDVPEWRALRLAPDVTPSSVRASLVALAEHAGVAPGRIGLVGFSFGAPQALAVVTRPDVREVVGGVVAFGGYRDLSRTVHFQFTGEHELDGHLHHLRPDPYGRWVVGANYLTCVPGYEDAGPVCAALERLAALAGDLGLDPWDPRLDALASELRTAMPRDAGALFDLFCPPGLGESPGSETDGLAAALVAAAVRADPSLDPGPVLTGLDRPVHILHGRRDRLIPYSEGVRLARALPPGVLARSTVTSLFAHAAGDRVLGPLASAREGLLFLRALAGVLGLV